MTYTIDDSEDDFHVHLNKIIITMHNVSHTSFTELDFGQNELNKMANTFIRVAVVEKSTTILELNYSLNATRHDSFYVSQIALIVINIFMFD